MPERERPLAGCSADSCRSILTSGLEPGDAARPPALLTRMSTPPKALPVASITAALPSSVIKSPSAIAARPPASSIWRTTAWVRSAFRPWTTTPMPSAASMRAISEPIPDELPVTSALFPASCRSTAVSFPRIANRLCAQSRPVRPAAAPTRRLRFNSTTALHVAPDRRPHCRRNRVAISAGPLKLRRRSQPGPRLATDLRSRP